ncbi:MAG: hypothetical protein CVT95_07790 [Bacteroidetes bacterium HGW-Bacteroidetes-12]|nr:MAG: hypothetical protein CVT95_07790 [Bacteroidetes bacterium HGW-Bacteroidetes-12]
MTWLTSIATAQNPNSNAGGLNWKITGNQATASDFIGTTNNQKLVFKCNNVTALEITPNAEARFMEDVVLDKLKPVIPMPIGEVRIVTSDNNGKLTSLDRSGLLQSIYTSPSTCISTGVNVGLPIWSALANANFGVLYTGIDCPARVGIGTNNPISALQVVGTGFFQGNLGVNVAPTTTEVLKISSTINRTSIEIINNHPTAFALKYGIKNIVNNPNTIAYSVTDQATNQDVFVVKGDGSVGIGTTNPLEVFQIGEEFTFHSGGTKSIARNYYFDNAQNVSRRIRAGAASALRFNEGGSIDLWTITSGPAGSIIAPADINKGLHIANNGNVGIGTTAVNDAKLSVEGIIRARRVLVNVTPWADYVFEPTYQLMSISQLENYVTANKHLPNMPTAEQVEKEGADLGEINRVLVEKVEELTLYIIELNKRMELLEVEKNTKK